MAYNVNASKDINIAVVFDKSSYMKKYDTDQIVGLNALMELSKIKTLVL